MEFSIRGGMLALALVTLLAGRAEAQGQAEEAPAPQEPADDAADTNDAEGQALFQAGRHAFDDGRFTEALELFERAQARSGRSALYYNVALAADRAGLEERALEAYEAFVEGDPENPRVRMVSARIEVLRQQLAERADRGEETSDENADPQGTDPVETPSEGGGRVWSYVLLGAGVALGAAATGVWLRARSDFDDLDETCAPDCADADVDAVERKVRWTNGLMFSGIAVGVGAVLAFVLEGRSTQVDAEVSRNHLQVGVRHAF